MVKKWELVLSGVLEKCFMISWMDMKTRLIRNTGRLFKNMTGTQNQVFILHIKFIVVYFPVEIQLFDHQATKFDLHLPETKVKEYCQDKNIPLIGKISFDPSVVRAMVEAKTIVEYSDGKVKQQISQVWDKLQKEEGGW